MSGPDIINQAAAICVSWMPDGNGGMQPTPDLLTLVETIRYFRLDKGKTRFPEDTLRRYRKQGKLRAVQIGKQVRYPRTELERFVENQVKELPP